MIRFKSKKIDITPKFPSRLTGMTFNEKSQDVHSRLEINACEFNQNEDYFFLISIDTLFVNNELKNIILKEIQKFNSSIEEKDIIVMSTHTHYAPSIERKRTELGAIDEDYFKFLSKRLQELCELLKAESYSEVDFEVSKGKSSTLTSNRRRKVRKISDFFNPFIAMEPNLEGFKNEEIKIIKIIEKKSDQLLGVIWTFPCHPTNLFNEKLISAEFPGAVRNTIRNQQDSNDLSIIYMPGFAGDVRAFPPKRKSINKWLRSTLQLSYPVKFYRFLNKEEYSHWVQDLTQNFFKVWGNSVKIENIHDSKLTIKLNKKEISILGIKVEGINEIFFRKVSFGTELAFYTMSSETVSEYSKILDRVAFEEFCIYTGYSDEVFGYLPTSKQINEGGYESQEFFKPFLVSGQFKSNIENTIESCFKEIN